MTKRFLSLIEFLFILIIALVISGCSREALINTPAPETISISTPAPASTQILNTPSSTSLMSSKPSILPGDKVIGISAAIINYNLEYLIQQTDAAVTGKVTAILPAKQDETKLPQTYFYTDVIIQPERYLYGEPQADLIAVRVDGGRIGDIAMIAEDEPEFTLGEECTIFVNHQIYAHTAPAGFTTDNYYIVWADCKYNIHNGILNNKSDKRFALSDVEQEIVKQQKK